MNRALIRVGDPTSHGGKVLEGSPNFIVDGKPVARLGDKASCPIHGDTAIDSGSKHYFTDAKPTARDGDTTACGATLAATHTHYLIR
ncbi:PAAR domain-containing protein [Massilia forsythiae]|uniref:PAAR domain-containing protein n=1 Tax=Massilia forsythiae TaxID=2728020 RepID=A0A7Z2ZUN4_9BURK|nr:PAAR domain-containing protein [Massilia forsythiae]QJE02485.1 PAAR domain-containing protein [Massilia forsythiae]